MFANISLPPPAGIGYKQIGNAGNVGVQFSHTRGGAGGSGAVYTSAATLSNATTGGGGG